MPQLIKPGSVKIITKDGEVSVSITLDLNINLSNLLEGVSLPSQGTKKENQDDKITWAIPDFNSEKINFGKKGE